MVSTGQQTGCGVVGAEEHHCPWRKLCGLASLSPDSGVLNWHVRLEYEAQKQEWSLAVWTLRAPQKLQSLGLLGPH